MENNENLVKTNVDLGFVIDRKSKDFSFVPSWTYKRLIEENIICCDDVIQDITPYEDDDYHLDFWPTCGHFFVIENGCISQWVLQNTALVYDLGFRILKIDNGPYQDVALSIKSGGLNYDTFYFLPLYELLVSRGWPIYDHQ